LGRGTTSCATGDAEKICDNFYSPARTDLNIEVVYVFASRSRIQTFHVAGRLVDADTAVAANIKNGNGDLPIHLASYLYSNKIDVFSVLVDHAGDLDVEGSSGETVLEIAVKRNQTGRLARPLKF
jgi:ankyrin repeat protein